MDKVNVQKTIDQSKDIIRKIYRYKLLIFIVFVAVIYGYSLMRIHSLYNEQPSQNSVAAQNNPLKGSAVDKSVVSQLQALRDNSVNVKTLFDQTRSNPFQE